MASPTVANVISDIQSLLGDPSGKVVTTAKATFGYEAAYRRLRQAMLNRQIQFVKKIVLYTLPAGTSSLTPAAAGITDFGELVSMEERAGSSSDRYSAVIAVESLPQYATQGASLDVYEWREDKWYFNPATLSRELRITYFDNSEPPASGTVGIDGARRFLGLYGAAVVGPTVQYDEEATRLMVQSVGSALDDQPKESGELLRLMMAMVRTLQKTPIQPNPYAVGRTYRRAHVVPHIAAPYPEGSLVPLTFSGTQDGVNATFTLSPSPRLGLLVILNGVTLKEGVGYSRSGANITFLSGYIPAAEDVLMAVG